MKIEKRKANGFLAELISNIDKKELKRTENRMMIAMKISMALKKKGISQKRFAQIMGKSTTVISEWLAGNRNFTIDTLTDISEELEIKLLNTNAELNIFIPNNNHCTENAKVTDRVFNFSLTNNYSTTILQQDKEEQYQYQKLVVA